MNDEKRAETDDNDQIGISLQPADEALHTSNRETVVMVAQSVLEEVRRHGKEDSSREQGGILVGTVASSQDKVYVNVEAVIAAPQTRAKRTSVTFTHDSWAHINQVKDSDYPNQDIVGWYHTHPGFGIFLSDYDTFIHRNFFPAAWQVAFVLDPLSGESGFFVWKDNIVCSECHERLSTSRQSIPTGEKPETKLAATDLETIRKQLATAGKAKKLGWCIAIPCACAGLFCQFVRHKEGGGNSYRGGAASFLLNALQLLSGLGLLLGGYLFLYGLNLEEKAKVSISSKKLAVRVPGSLKALICGILSILIPLAGLILGYVAIKSAAKSADALVSNPIYYGRILCKEGKYLGIVGVIIGAPILFAILIGILVALI